MKYELQDQLGGGKLKGKYLQEYNLYKTRIDKHGHIEKLKYGLKRLKSKKIVRSK